MGVLLLVMLLMLGLPLEMLLVGMSLVVVVLLVVGLLKVMLLNLIFNDFASGVVAASAANNDEACVSIAAGDRVDDWGAEISGSGDAVGFVACDVLILKLLLEFLHNPDGFGVGSVADP